MSFYTCTLISIITILSEFLYNSDVELIGPRWRAHVNAWYGYMWSIGGLVMCALAYVIRQWRYLQLALSAQMLLFLLYFM